MLITMTIYEFHDIPYFRSIIHQHPLLAIIWTSINYFRTMGGAGAIFIMTYLYKTL